MSVQIAIVVVPILLLEFLKIFWGLILGVSTHIDYTEFTS